VTSGLLALFQPFDADVDGVQPFLQQRFVQTDIQVCRADPAGRLGVLPGAGPGAKGKSKERKP
jgi:hypothetical protein